MRISYYPYELILRNPFGISRFTRTVTPALLVTIEHEGLIGYGEASLPQYLGETVTTVISFISKIDLSIFHSPEQINDILDYIDSLSLGDTAAKASVDIALHDLLGKMRSESFAQMYGLEVNVDKIPFTSFTIGLDSDDMILKKTEEAKTDFRTLKVKLGSERDKQIIEKIRTITSLPLAVDANQGWSDRSSALDMIYWLHSMGIVMVEQPMQKHLLDDIAWVNERSPIPIFADESVQRLSDMERLKGVFSGVNIKLMKCTGMREAFKMKKYANEQGLMTMIGCMTETSCAITAASHLTCGVDFVDLDGALLINNDCFVGATLIDGRILPPYSLGIGVQPNNLFPI